MDLNKYGITIPEFYLPNKSIDMNKWAVVACDQYTSEPEYWREVYETVGDSPSTLNMIFPELYLSEKDAEKRISNINTTMNKYLDNGILSDLKRGFVYIERKMISGLTRTGLLVKADLDAYDFSPASHSLIRATEQTILDRLPPRIKIRENAPLESPHIMMLCDDPALSIIEPFAAIKDKLEKLYDTELMGNGGHITGYLIDSPEYVNRIYSALEKILASCPTDPFLFAVGDGNHSLATAKKCWEKIKQTLSEEDRQNCPARYALVELVNIHDSGIVFEPIHRVLFNVNPDEVVSFVKEYCAAGDTECLIEYVSLKGKGKITFNIDSSDDAGAAATAILQHQLDIYLSAHPDSSIDYVHGCESAENLGRQNGNVSFLLPVMNKHTFFAAVKNYGVLTRKTFSMGEANEKRYYLECRKIK